MTSVTIHSVNFFLSLSLSSTKTERLTRLNLFILTRTTGRVCRDKEERNLMTEITERTERAGERKGERGGREPT